MMPRAQARGGSVGKSRAWTPHSSTPASSRARTTTLLDSLKADHSVVATLEDGSLDGGFGERISRYYGPTTMKVLNFGVKKALYDRYNVDELLVENHLTEPQIVADVMKALG